MRRFGRVRQLDRQHACRGAAANAIWEGDERFDFRIFHPRRASSRPSVPARRRVTRRAWRRVCWPWSKPTPRTLLDDVVLGDWRRPWNARPEAKRLAAGIRRLSCWRTNRVDSIRSVVFTPPRGSSSTISGSSSAGPPVRHDAQAWIGDRKASFDRPVKQGGEAFIDLVKTPIACCSRGASGCYVHFVDRDTERFFRTRIDGRVAEPGSTSCWRRRPRSSRSMSSCSGESRQETSARSRRACRCTISRWRRAVLGRPDDRRGWPGR